VDGGKVSAERRPLNKSLCPERSLDNVLGLVLLVVPVDADVITAVRDELVAAAL
jgi:hypothetical protein